MQKKTNEDLAAENEELRIRLQEAQDTLDAIRRGEVDGVVVYTPKGEQIYTLSGAEKPYRLLIEEMKEGAVMLSDDNTILYCNRGFAKMLGCSLEMLAGSNVEKRVSPIFKEPFLELLGECRGIGKKNSLTRGISFVSCQDNSLVPTQISVNSLDIGNGKTTFIVVTDLREHMKEELKTYTADLEKAGAALFESEQRWSTTLASIGDAVIATDLAGKVTFMNKVAAELTGWRLNEARQKPVQEIFKVINEKTRKVVDDPVRKVISRGVTVGLANHTVLIRKDGTEIAVDDSGAPIKDKNGQNTGVVLIFRDITERRKAEEKLEEYRGGLERLVEERTKELQSKERLATIGATAGMVGHDIRNPLQAIVGDLFLVRGEMKVMPPSEGKNNMQESLDEIEENISYINKIVSDLQDFTRVLTPSLEKVSVCDLIDETLAAADVPDKIQIQVIAQNLVIDADPTFLRRVLTNLITNAVQAMQKGGKLTIEGKQTDGYAILSVRDTGVGIAEAVKPSLFTPLFTTKSKGQGLGLAVVKRIVEAMDGTISFESQVGVGTTFTIKVPLKKPQKASNQSK